MRLALVLLGIGQVLLGLAVLALVIALRIHTHPVSTKAHLISRGDR